MHITTLGMYFTLLQLHLAEESKHLFLGRLVGLRTTFIVAEDFLSLSWLASGTLAVIAKTLKALILGVRCQQVAPIKHFVSIIPQSFLTASP